MNNWSSFKNDKLLMESWRSYLNEDIESQRLSEDLNRELEKLDELFGFGKSREDKWKAIADGDDEEDAQATDTAQPEPGQEKEKERGFFGKMADYAKGIKDISGFFGKGAGTLLGGEETLDIKKRKQFKDTAKAEIEKWVNGLNYPPVATIYKKLSSEQFPNNDKNDFNSQIALAEKAYETIVSEHNAGEIDTPRANIIIAVMRGMVIYFQDFAIADRYMYIKEEEEDTSDEPTESGTIGAKQGAVSKNVASAYSAKLPLGLAAAGSAALLGGFAADSEWFQEWLLTLRDMKETIEVEEILEKATETLDLGEVKPGEGIIKVIRRLVPGQENFATAEGAGLGFLKDPKNKLVFKLIKAAMKAQGSDVTAFEGLVDNDADAFTTFVSGTDLAGHGGTSMAIDAGEFQGQFQKIIGQSIERVKRQPAKTIKNWFIKSAGAYLGPLLKALGIGALAGAGVSAAMRAKGKRSSRMAQLKNLVDSMLDVTPQDGETKPIPPKPGGGDLEDSADNWVAAGKPGHEDPSFMDGKSVSSTNLVTRGSDNFLKDNPGDPDDVLKPDALALAYQQLAWLKAHPGKTAPQRNGRNGFMKDLQVRIQATEKDKAGNTSGAETPKGDAQQPQAKPAQVPASAQPTPGTPPAQPSSGAPAAPAAAWDPKLGAQPAKKAGESDEDYAARLKRAAWAAKSRLSELKRWQKIAGILKG
tara:strand:- start:1219 stop:3321 length:2103 start_codon:yes stop_codon:yes gene_type:complete